MILHFERYSLHFIGANSLKGKLIFQISDTVTNQFILLPKKKSSGKITSLRERFYESMRIFERNKKILMKQLLKI